MKGIADTGVLVALLNRGDLHHDWALRVLGEVKGPLLTCEPVLAETAFHIGSSKIVLGMLTDGLIQVGINIAEQTKSLEKLAIKYADRSPDLADVCVIRLSELHPDHMVLTTDKKDFSVYRRNQKERIPFLSPP